MKSVFSVCTDEERMQMLPKARVAVALYHRHNALLSHASIRALIAEIDADVEAIIGLVYDKKQYTRSSLSQRVKQQQAKSDALLVQITEPERFEKKSIFGSHAEVSVSDKIGLIAQGAGNMYKRTLPNDINTLLSKY